MQITNSNYSIAEMLAMLRRRELIVNNDYQRGSGLWPDGPSSYFIDTILERYPFPKIYLYERFDPGSINPIREIVDGQQRVKTITRFAGDEFALGSESRFAGQRFSDLDDETRQGFLSYAVSADVIRNARASEILQMFRRMNAYTLPLNEAERRHSIFQGAFKWFVNDICDEENELFTEFGVFTDRQIVRMADAELVTEIAVAMERGIVSASVADLRAIYMNNEAAFPQADNYRDKIVSSFEFIRDALPALRRSHMMKPYAVHSLVTALIHARYGIASIEQQWNATSIGQFASNPLEAESNLVALAQAHEAKELDGPFGTYVWGCIGGTNRAPRRTARVAAILRALGVNVPAEIDANLA